MTDIGEQAMKLLIHKERVKFTEIEKPYGECYQSRINGKIIVTSTLLMLGDVLGFSLSYMITIMSFDNLLMERLALLVSIAFILMNRAASLYPGYRLHPHERMRRRLLAGMGIWLTASFGLLVLFGDWKMVLSETAFLFTALAIQPLIQSAIRLMARAAGIWGEPAVILAPSGLKQKLTAYFQDKWEYGINPVPANSPLGGPPLDGDASRNGAILEDQPAWDRAVVLIGAKDHMPLPELAEISRRHRDVILLADMPHIRLFGLQPNDVRGCIGLQLYPRGRGDVGAAFRRTLDLVIAVPALIFTAPVVLAAIGAIWLVDPNPVFYSQVREGLHGRKIRVLKLRTMYKDAEQRLETLLRTDAMARAEWTTRFKLRNDPRILPLVGKLLRKSSCDELPQLINVIMGDMSIVGPRPFPEYHLSAMSPDLRKERATEMPGITGLWQISDRSDADVDLQQQLDSFYVRNSSFWLDLHILIKTVVVVIRGKGAY